MTRQARLWRVNGYVQGVGFRSFVQARAQALGLAGWVRNDDDGSVSVYAVGDPRDLDRLAGFLYLGPGRAAVRGVEQQEAPVQQLNSFLQK